MRRSGAWKTARRRVLVLRFYEMLGQAREAGEGMEDGVLGDWVKRLGREFLAKMEAVDAGEGDDEEDEEDESESESESESEGDEMEVESEGTSPLRAVESGSLGGESMEDEGSLISDIILGNGEDVEM